MDLTNLSDITFIYDHHNKTCSVSIKGSSECLLENKGITNKEGYWYQLDENKHHWISFNPDKFNNSKVEVFYKRPDDTSNTGFKYYRQTFQNLEQGDSLIMFSFSEFDEWIKDRDGKWKSKYQPESNENKQPWKN